MKKGEVASRIMEIGSEAKTMDELHDILHEIAFALGGMVCHFAKDDRSPLIVELTQAMGYGLMLTAKNIGEPSDIEIVVGRKAK